MAKPTITIDNMTFSYNDNPLKLSDALDYEIRSNWIASFIWFGWGQELLGRYFAWKVKRKHKRYKKSINFTNRLYQKIMIK